MRNSKGVNPECELFRELFEREFQQTHTHIDNLHSNGRFTISKSAE